MGRQRSIRSDRACDRVHGQPLFRSHARSLEWGDSAPFEVMEGGPGKEAGHVLEHVGGIDIGQRTGDGIANTTASWQVAIQWYAGIVNESGTQPVGQGRHLGGIGAVTQDGYATGRQGGTRNVPVIRGIASIKT